MNENLLRARIAAREAEAEKHKAEAEKLAADARTSLAEALVAEANARAVEEAEAERLAGDLNNYVYNFHQAVGSGSVGQCIRQLNIWRRRDHSEEHPLSIEIVFNSPGGSVVDGMNLWDYLQELRREGIHITTVARGMAASMAGILLQAGDKRVMSSEAYLLIHEVQAGMMGSWGELEDRMKWLEKVQDRIINIFAERSNPLRWDPDVEKPVVDEEADFNTTRRAIKLGWKRTDWWLDADEAKEYGFCDEVR